MVGCFTVVIKGIRERAALEEGEAVYGRTARGFHVLPQCRSRARGSAPLCTVSGRFQKSPGPQTASSASSAAAGKIKVFLLDVVNFS